VLKHKDASVRSVPKSFFQAGVETGAISQVQVEFPPNIIAHSFSSKGEHVNFILKSANRKSAYSCAHSAITNPQILSCANPQIANPQFLYD
jgi:hypothetical protein